MFDFPISKGDLYNVNYCNYFLKTFSLSSRWIFTVPALKKLVWHIWFYLWTLVSFTQKAYILCNWCPTGDMWIASFQCSSRKKKNWMLPFQQNYHRSWFVFSGSTYTLSQRETATDPWKDQGCCWAAARLLLLPFQ